MRKDKPAVDIVALAVAVLLFAVLLLIATVWAHHRLIRGVVGDAVAVTWVYFLLRTVAARWPTLLLAMVALGIGCGLELMQYLASAAGWQIHGRLLRILVGSVADWLDIAAYAVGFAVALALERLSGRWR